jgi:hypothetical protein
MFMIGFGYLIFFFFLGTASPTSFAAALSAYTAAATAGLVVSLGLLVACASEVGGAIVSGGCTNSRSSSSL